MTARIIFKLGLLAIFPLVATAIAAILLANNITTTNLEEGLKISLLEKARLAKTVLQQQSSDLIQGTVLRIA